MSLQPLLRKKVEELYFRWLTDPNTQAVLKENLQQLKNGDSVADMLAVSPPRPAASPSFLSPRAQVGPQVPQPPNKTISPRSPRRSLSSGVNSKLRKDGKENITPRSLTSVDNHVLSHLTKNDDDPSFVDSESHNSMKCPPRRPRSKQKSSNAAVREVIPQFFFPVGRPRSKELIENEVRRAIVIFDKLEGNVAKKADMGKVAEACNVPWYWKQLLFNAAGGVEGKAITRDIFRAMWHKILSNYHDEASRFVALCTKCQRDTLCHDDFLTLIQDVIDTHSGLAFLQESPEFHSRYVHTVISRIFFTVNASWSGNITISELKKSNFLSVLGSLQEYEDINLITDYFSYEHFYVIYCKFWELDTDHDLFISKEDLARHNNYAISSRMIDRIFSGAVTRGKVKMQRMSYPEFVWFLMAEEDKRQPRSIEYWFRCLDIDGDGVLSMYELEYFYSEQLQRMTELGIQDQILFEDCICQMLDLVKPQTSHCIRLSDLKRCKMANVFLDTFFNLNKFMEREQRDPFANLKEIEEGRVLSDWEKYAAETYDLLVAEENNGGEDDYFYEDDFIPDEDNNAINFTTSNTRSSAFDSEKSTDDHFMDAMGLDVISRRSSGPNTTNAGVAGQTSDLYSRRF